MKALSFRQPWADLVALGIKRIENRPTRVIHPRLLPLHLYIHASKTQGLPMAGKTTREADQWIHDRLTSRQVAQHFDLKVGYRRGERMGAFVGEVDVVGLMMLDGTPDAPPPKGIEPLGVPAFQLINIVSADQSPDVRLEDARWATGPYCYVLENAVWYAEPIPYRGRQGLFDAPDLMELIGRAV